jgi:serine protease AprX
MIALRKLLILTLVLALAGTAVAQTSSKLSPDLQVATSSSSSGNLQVVVQYYTPPTQSDLNLLGLVGSLLNQLPLVNAIVEILPISGILNLASQPNVKYISLDRSVGGSLSNAAPAVNAPYAWSHGYTGSGVGVAVVDSGIDNVPDLYGGSLLGLIPQSRVVFNQSFVPGGLLGTTSSDQYGHGSHVAGLIGGNGAASTGWQYTKSFKGIAPSASLVNLRVLDQNGQGTDSQVIAAIQRAIQLKNTYNIRVMNLSLGRPVYESYTLDPVCQAVEQAWKAGIVVVVAAGNNGRFQPTSGYGTITSPANDPYVITVGSMKPMGTPTRSDDLVASYSSKGPTVIDHIVKPDIVAPGNLLVSLNGLGTLYNQYPSNRVPLSYYVQNGSSSISSAAYFTLSGTSMAAGVVSGIVADLLQAQPSLTPDQVKARLMKTASKTFPMYSSVTDPATGITYTDQYDVFTIGAGYVDLAAALSSTDVATGTAMSPTVVYDGSSGNYYLSSNPSAVWGTSSTWSGAAVWGTTVFNSNSFMWGSGSQTGSSFMWGSGGQAGTSFMWGSGSLWGSSAAWGSSAQSGYSTIWSDSFMWGSNGMWGSSFMWGSSANKGE